MPLNQYAFPPKHLPLRQDLETLEQLLADVLQQQAGERLNELMRGDLALSTRWGEADPGVAMQLMVRARGRSPDEARELSRAYSTWFELANVAEKVHRTRRQRDYFRQRADRPQPGGVHDLLLELKSSGLDLSQVLDLLSGLSIEPVLVAHPMESTRRTTLRREQRVAALLIDADNASLAPHERQALLDKVHDEIGAEWQSEEHPRDRLTVADEREHAIFYLAEVFYRILPDFYGEIAAALARLYGVERASIRLPLMLRFGTWVGGDMASNADVHAKSVRETLARAQRVIIENYLDECRQLADVLSQSANRVGVSAQVTRRIDEYRALLPGMQTTVASRHDRMPYRVLFGQIVQRLVATNSGRASGYEHPSQLRADVQLVADSLTANRGARAGLELVRRLLYRIDTFGFHLATLDLRVPASVHHQVLAQGLEDPQWMQRLPAERHARLVDLLERDTGPTGQLDALGKRTLAVFDAIAQSRHRFGDQAIGLYVVSNASQADDVLAPLVLARWAGAYDVRKRQVALDVAPEFDTVATLNECSAVMRQLLDDAVYRRHLAGRDRQQSVLIGFSGSGVDGGLMASRLAAYSAERNMTAALDQAHESHLLFYCRGGSIPRGGGRIDALLRASPAEAVNGQLRFTEQGQNIQAHYGLHANALRTLERAFATLSAATLAVKRGIAVKESNALAACGAIVAEASARCWRELLHDPGFDDYYQAVTPIDVIERMRIGRTQFAAAQHWGAEARDPAAWVYAWSQSRHMIPGWYGAGTGLARALQERGLELLRTCYLGWPFFRHFIDDTETMLARSDLPMAACYDKLAGTAAPVYAPRIAAEFERTRDLVLQIKQSTKLLDTDRTLQRGISIRNPYIFPMNLMQIDLLQRWRGTGRNDAALLLALQATVSGIARGLQITG